MNCFEASLTAAFAIASGFWSVELSQNATPASEASVRNWSMAAGR